jgi:hypothetical protein
MITHARIARYIAQNHRFRTYTREDLDYMKQIERGIQSAVRCRNLSTSVTTSGTSKLVVARAQELLGLLEYRTEIRPVGVEPYLFIFWGPNDRPATQPAAASSGTSTEAQDRVQGEGSEGAQPPSAT